MQRLKNFKQVIYLLLSLALSLGLGWYFFSHHSIADVLDALRGVPPRYIYSFLIFSLLMSVFRAWRYRLLLSANGYECQPFSLFLVTIVRNLFSDLLPARLGTLIYIYLVNTRLAVPVSAATSSFAYAFLFDIVAVCPLIAFCLLSFAVPAQIHSTAMLLAVVVLLVLSAVLIALLPSVVTYAASLAQQIGGARTKVVERFLAEIATSLNEVKQAGIYGRVFVLSVVTRSLKYAALYVFLLGLGKSLGLSQEVLSLEKSLLGLLSAEFAASLPISGISGFGAYEGAWAFTFSLLGVEQRLAEMTAFSHHIFTQTYGYAIGITGLLILLLPAFYRPHASKAKKLSSVWSFAIKLCIALIIGFAAALLPLIAASQPLYSGVDLQVWKPTDELPEIIFDSNRAGSFGIYATWLNKREVVKIVDTAAQEMFPEISPDNNFVAYSRHLSLSRQSPADVVIRSLQNATEEIIADGAFPSFSSDGKKLYFERQRSKVIEYELESKTLREIFPAEKFAEFSGFQMVKPRLSADGRYLVFTSDKAGRWHAWLADLQQGVSRLIGAGCEPVFHPDGKSLVWVQEKQMKQGSGFMVLDLASGKQGVFLDSAEPWGREYFPSFSRDASKLLFAATSPGPHSHETANYQLFSYDLSSYELKRLTQDSFTNRWPKLVKYHKGDAE